jgi:hypothetical protein
MLPIPTTNLPAFDRAQLDKRFLTELERLLQAEAFTSYDQWAKTVGVSASYVAGMASGRYHCNLKLLYNTLRFFPGTDLGYVLFGSAVYARPEPTAAPVRKRGRPFSVNPPPAEVVQPS